MEVTINLPDDVVKVFSANGANVEREVLEATALEGYREGKLSQAQVRRMLGFATDMQVDDFLKKHDVFLNYTIEDLEQDRRTLEALFSK
jgi:predicted HTH domain antitoxin